ncbi:MAG: HemK family protein methyltransferase [Candidatus Paceibacterota bacterium]|jgi:release factor glutamine methyltransferase
MKKEEKYLNWLRQDKYSGNQIASTNLAKDLSRLRQGEPIDYVIGWKSFLGCKIDLTERPLIPREETEYWTEKAITEIKKENKRQTIKCLDIFAGSGCIGLAVLINVNQAKVIFADKNLQALKTLKKNLKLNRDKVGPNRAKIVRSNVFSNVRGTFDYIFANPPYIPLAQKLASSVTKYEPREALYGGRDGFFYLKKFLKQAPAYLKINGKIYLEFGYGQKKAVDKFLKKNKYKSWLFGKDQFGRYRFAIIQK